MLPFLETERLLLRAYELKDARQAQVLAGDKDLAETTFLPHPYTLETAGNWISSHPKLIENREAFPFAVILKGEDQLIGTMTLRVDDLHNKGELAYWIGKDYWNNGYATEASKIVIDFGFKKQNLNRIWAPVMTKNKASGKVMQKVGLKYEGTLKQDILRWDEYEDVDVFGLLKEDYLETESSV
ncbi:GNAT family N-acetyltransferase [Halobacillus locisalis]|uniref:GNAT family N-acetyltransferase n=1 Tax=Halobacillus locisalis TaxID=220753 RepID=A0A838CRW6_9BACI|nr:GNAT family N-acetyltransferase [Halobacillus locisalis]MBA2174872.1 GNAT family N-acetyltransferase [Halobacillus locisalis]